MISRYIGLREVPGAQPPDAVLGVCARGDAASPGHRLPLHSAEHAFACEKSGALVGLSDEAQRKASAIKGEPMPDGWRCCVGCRGPSPPPPPGDRSRPRFGIFDDVETAAADVRVREALGLAASQHSPRAARARWIGLLYETQPDGSRLVVGVCHTHKHTTRVPWALPGGCASLSDPDRVRVSGARHSGGTRCRPAMARRGPQRVAVVRLGKALLDTPTAGSRGRVYQVCSPARRTR